MIEGMAGEDLPPQDPGEGAPGEPFSEEPTAASDASDEGDATASGPDPLAELTLHLERVRACIQRYALVYPSADGGEAEDVDPEGTARRTLERHIFDLDEALAGLHEEAGAVESPIGRVKRRFGLPDSALLLLMFAAAPQLDVGILREMALARGHAAVSEMQLDVQFAIEALAQARLSSTDLVQQLRPQSLLLRARLIRLGQARGFQQEAPLLRRPLMVPERVCAWLRGEANLSSEHFGEHFGRVAHIQTAHGAQASAGRELGAQLGRALFRERDGRRLPVFVSGPAQSGKAQAVAEHAAARGAVTLVVDVEGLVLQPQAAELLWDLHREALFLDAVLLLRHAEVLRESYPEVRRALIEILGQGAAYVVVSSQSELGELWRRVPGSTPVQIDLPSEREQLALWQRALPSELRWARDLSPAVLVRRYRLSPGDILEAGAQAAAAARARLDAPQLELEDVVTAIRQRLRHRLSDVAEVLTTSLEWEDLILPVDLWDRINELMSSIRYRKIVMKEWGFERKMAYGRALSGLFFGPPGTGKTMVATLIAKTLGLELFRVDLSRVVSKWVGETEKNLGKVFDEAKNSQAVLLFDEADSLFGKRTEVKSANDRYANIEVNYLLQRIETFDGIALLTTNKRTAMDEAFCRRLRFRIEFPEPEAEERELLWRSMLPPEAPLAPEIDFRALAERYTMTGGYIKNAVLRAAYLAAATPQRVITEALLLRGAQLEWEEMGNLAVELS